MVFNALSVTFERFKPSILSCWTRVLFRYELIVVFEYARG
jgi:hypothetical protein